MRQSLRIRATVQVGGRIEIQDPSLTTGEELDVILLSPTAKRERRPALQILAEAPGHRLFKTAEDVDAYLREERGAWD